MIDGFPKRLALQTVQAAEVFDHLLRRKPAIRRGRVGKKTYLRAHFCGLEDAVETRDVRRPRGGFKNRGQHPQSRCFSGAVSPQQAINLARSAPEADRIDSANFSALLVAENLRELMSCDHLHGLSIIAEKREGRAFAPAPVTAGPLSLVR